MAPPALTSGPPPKSACTTKLPAITSAEPCTAMPRPSPSSGPPKRLPKTVTRLQPPGSGQPQRWAGPGLPPPQVSGAVKRPPQLSCPPQPSETVPQLLPAHAVACDAGVQPQTLGMPPPPHVSGAAQSLG